jgi:nucleoside-diphosphate-sugar epimerase
MAFTKICLALLSRTEFPLTGDGLQARDFTYVDDAVTATIMAMRDAPTGIYNVGGGKPVSMRSAIELFEASSDMKLKVRPIPEQSGDVRRTDANFLKLHDVTGWRPAHDVTTGIDAQWRWAIGRRMELLAATGHGLQAPHGRED